jgi:endonuclease/exonuclease/phosphatase family metal-dependent hydrolase
MFFSREEVTKIGLETIKQQTGYEYIFCDIYRVEAIGFAFNPKTVRVLEHPQRAIFHFNRETPRALLSVPILFKGKPMHIYVTHLDHQDENVRMKQINSIMQRIEQDKFERYKGKEFPHILLGDFNALKKEDYTKQQWDDITKIRKRNSWEAPKTDLTSYIADKDYTDLLEIYSTKAKTQIPLTSRFKTRVDYIFSYKNNYTIVDAGFIDNNDSDHKAIYVELKI